MLARDLLLLHPKNAFMRTRIILLLLVVLPLLAFTGAHKFYVSVTNVEYSAEAQSLQIVSRLFVDDMEQLLETRYGLDAGLGTKDESPLADDQLRRYFNSKFSVSVNGEERACEYLGKRYENDLAVFFLEVPGIPEESLRSVEIRNELLTDLFEEQKNLVHLKVLGEKKSWVLIRERPKGMLNL